MPGARCGDPHRRESRFALEARFRRVGRYARRHGSLGDGVPARLSREGVRSGCGVDEVEQYAGHGGGLPASGGRDGAGRDGLSAPPGRHRGRERDRGAHQECCRYRSAFGGRYRRYDPRFADRSARKRDSGSTAFGRSFCPPQRGVRRQISGALYADAILSAERYTNSLDSLRVACRLAGDRSPDRESYGRAAGRDPEPRPGGRTCRGVPPLRGSDGRSRRRQSRRRSGAALSGRVGGRHSDRRAAPFGKGDRGDRADDPAGGPRADVPHRIHRLPELRSYAL